MNNSVSAQDSASHCSDLLNTTVTDIDGKEVNLCKYQGKVLLIVNTASKCGFTGQYADLEKLYEKYKDKGFEVLAFPSNDFMNQEPAGDEQIKKFCTLNYDTTFPLFSKIHVKGKEQNLLYSKLAKSKGSPAWNFQKYLISRKGEVVQKYAPFVSPMSKDLEKSILVEINK